MRSAKVICDSLAPCGQRLTTLELNYPRVIHSEFMTHRTLSRNAGSSRAIPASRYRAIVEADPVIPLHIGRNQPGMQAREELQGAERSAAITAWRNGLHRALATHRELEASGAHKQMVNRVLEPYAYIRVIVSATSWDGFYFQRTHKDADPEFQHLAKSMLAAMQTSTPVPLRAGQHHLPYLHSGELVGLHIETKKKLSTARSARVSYLTHDKALPDALKDIALHDRLLAVEPGEPQHLSPFEHVAMALSEATPSGNFRGWQQYRKEVEIEPTPAFRWPL